MASRLLGLISNLFQVTDNSENAYNIFDLNGDVHAGSYRKTVSHDYGAAAADWTLSVVEDNAGVLKATNASGAVNIIAPTDSGRIYMVDNQSGQALTIKKSGGTGITIASTKRAMVWYSGTDYVRLTADA